MGRGLALFIVCFVACVPVFAAGCLPAGSEPAGRQLVHDRTLSAVQFVPAQFRDEPARLVVFGPTRASRLFQNDMADLYAVSPSILAGPARHLEDLTLLLPDVQHPGPYDSSFSFAQTDSRGRMVVQSEDSASADPAVWRVDPAGAPREAMGSTFVVDPYSTRIQQIALSPGRSRVVVARPEGWAVYETDGRSVEVPMSLGGTAGFVGEDFYYTTYQSADDPGVTVPSNDVGVVVPGGQPQVMLANARLQAGFSASDGGHLVVANESPPGHPDLESASLIDLATHLAHSIPFSPSEQQWVGVSPDRKWLAWRGLSDIRFFEWAEGNEHRSSASLSKAVWRPGHHDLWYSASLATLVTSPTSDSASDSAWVYARTNPFWQPGTTSWSWFTPSGNYWLVRDFCDESLCGTADATWSDEAIYVGSADQPKALPTQVAAKGVALYRAWELDDGRILIEGYTQDAVRSDLYLFDPRTLATTVIPLKGFVVATGGSRVLAFASWELGRWAGRLVVIDLATGAETQLAESAYAARVDPGPFSDAAPADRLAAGTRVAYLLRHQIDSPWDGLWMAELP